MDTAEKIIEYLLETYKPDALIVYGSFADGSANENSDFDALVIADHVQTHDSSIVVNTVLDVFVYPSDTFKSDFDPEEFLQIFDGRIILDRTGIAAELQERIRQHIAQTPMKTEEEIDQEIAWCEKMMLRAQRGDAEGYYRWHWLLFVSLEIYCDIKRQHYYGPKKALRYMAKHDGEAFQIYSYALKELDRERLTKWIACLKKLGAE